MPRAAPMRPFLALVALALGFWLAPALPARAELDAETRAAIREEVRAYLLEHPEILQEMVAILEARGQGAQAERDRALIAEHADRIFADGFSYVGGDPEGDLTLVEFVDYQCGFCRRAHPEVRALLEEDGNLRLVVKELPILGPGSELAARAALATLMTAGGEAYERLHHALMTLEGPVTETSLAAALDEAGLELDALRETMEGAEVDRQLAETRALAADLGIAGTPTYVLGERMLRGYLPRQEMAAVLAEERARTAGE